MALFKNKRTPQTPSVVPDKHAEGEGKQEIKETILQEEQQERFEHDLSILEASSGGEQKLQKEAEREIRSAAENSLRRLHVIQRGRCPQCGESLRQHLFASICDSCGWHTFDVPRSGPVRIHLNNAGGVVDGERCYMVKNGSVLVLRGDVVIARVPANAVAWVEYVWGNDELDQRHRQVMDRTQINCGWCGKEANPDEDGFHMVQVAFGATQERYCFCSDDCFEAFRKMYPSRVHRNCYERSCTNCNLCIKRYEDEEAEGIRTLAKDYLHIRRKR